MPDGTAMSLALASAIQRSGKMATDEATDVDIVARDDTPYR